MKGVKESRALSRVTVRVFKDDLNYLRLAYPTSGYNNTVRALIARHVRALRTKTAENIGTRLSEEEIGTI